MRKKALLVNPHIEDFAAYDHFSKPLGLLWLASYLRRFFDVAFINCLDREHPSLENMRFKDDGTGDFNKAFIPKPPPLSDIPRRFKRYGLPDGLFLDRLKSLPWEPEFVFVTSAMTYWYTGVAHTVRLVREAFPGAKVILGGAYPALLPEHAAGLPGIDAAVPAQGLKEALERIAVLTGAPGLAEAGDDFLDPAYDLLGEYRYLPVLTSLGCVFRCSYCAGGSLQEFRQFDPGAVAGMIIRLNRTYKVRHFAFYDDALLYRPREHIDPILRRVAGAGLGAAFHSPNGLHVRFLTAETAGLMKAAGFTDIRLSLESSDRAFQDRSGGKAANDEFENAMGLLYRAGFERKQVRVYILLNVPGQDGASVERTMEYVYSRGALPMLSFYSPIPGTPDFKKAKQITGLDEPLFQNNTVYLYRSGFDIDLLRHLQDKELRFRRDAKQ